MSEHSPGGTEENHDESRRNSRSPRSVPGTSKGK
jgi:hypothetical protein